MYNFFILKPLSFYEYLVSKNHDQLVRMLENVTLQQPFELFIHEQLLLHLREYFLIGGMPSVVRSYLENGSFLECQTILTGLLETYRSDFPKYATSTQYTYLQSLFGKAPGLICNTFKYSHISPEYRAQKIKIALEQLGWAGLLNKVIATSASGIPLQVHAKENKFKLLFLDCGLVNCANKLDMQSAWDMELMQINSGVSSGTICGSGASGLR